MREVLRAMVALRSAAEHPEIFAVIADGLCPAHHRDYAREFDGSRGVVARGRDWAEYWLVDGSLALRSGTSIPGGVCASGAKLRDRPVLLIAAHDTPGEAAYAAMVRRIIGERCGISVVPGTHGSALDACGTAYRDQIRTFLRSALGAGDPGLGSRARRE